MIGNGTGIEVEVYADTNLSEKLDILNARMQPTIMQELKSNGAGSFSISKSDPKILANPSLIEYRRYVKVRVHGQVVGGFVIQTKKTIIVGDGEEAEEQWQVSGEGPRTWFSDAVVHSAGGLRRNAGETRFFNFSSEQGNWYNPANWINPTVVWGVREANNWWGTMPADWPDAPAAKWIWDRNNAAYSMPLGFCYFRYEFTVPAEKNYAFFFSCDDQAEIYVDGELKITSAEHQHYETAKLDLTLSAGSHIIAAKVQQNVPNSPGAFLGALFIYGDPSQPTAAQLVNVTDANTGWKIYPYPSVEPGWTAGQVLITLINEAKNRGVRFFQNATLTFSQTMDSAGVAWDFPQPYSFNLGASYLDVIESLEELGCDIFVDPDNLQISAWKRRGLDRSISAPGQSDGFIPIVLRPGMNLLKATETGQANIVNSLLIHTTDGWSVETPSSTVSQTKYGRIEGQISTDLSDATAVPLTDELFRQKALPEISATLDIEAVEGCVPFINFNVGDTISAPGEVPHTPESRRVMSISVSERESDGRPVYAIEFDTIFKDRTAELEKWISRTSNASGLGMGFSNSNSTPSTVIQQPPGTQLGSVPDAPTGLNVQSVGRFLPSGESTTDFGLTWNTVISGQGYGDPEIESYEVWARKLPQTQRTLQSTVFDAQAFLTGYTPGDVWRWSVRAVGRTGGPGLFSEEVELEAASPIIPLLTPSAPSLETSMGVVTVKWNGLLGGAPAPKQVSHINVFRDTVPPSFGPWTLARTNICADPNATNTSMWSASAGTLSEVASWGASPEAMRHTRSATGAARHSVRIASAEWTPGAQVSIRIPVRASENLTSVQVAIRPAVTSATNQTVLGTVTIPAGTSELVLTGTIPNVAQTTGGLAFIWSSGAVGSTFDATDILIEKTAAPGTFFSGATADAPAQRNEWAGTANASHSTQEVRESAQVNIGRMTGRTLTDATVTVGNTYTYSLQAVDTYDITSPMGPGQSITVTGVMGSDITGGLPSNNFVFNGSFESGLAGWEVVQKHTSAPDPEILEGGFGGLRYLRISRGAEPDASQIEYIVAQTLPNYTAVVGGDPSGYYLSARAQALADKLDAFSLRVYWYQADKTTPSATPYNAPIPPEDLTALPQAFFGQVFPPADAKWARVAIVLATPDTTMNVDDIIGRPVLNSDQIGENAITSLHISAGSIIANALAVGSVTADAIAAGSILSDKVAAGAIQTSHLSAAVGQELDISSNAAVNIIIRDLAAVSETAGTTQSELSELMTYYSFTAQGAIIGRSDSAFNLWLKNDRIEIQENGVVVSYWDSGQMVVPSFVGQEVTLANHKFLSEGLSTVIKAVQ